MSVILAISSSSAAVSVAILKNDELVCENFLNNGLFHSQTLMVLVKNTLDQSNLRISDVNLLAVSYGPGSFTGLRIGVSVAKGLGVGLGVQCAGISTLRGLAVNLVGLPVLACAVIYARNDNVYCGLFDMATKGLGIQLGYDEVLSINSLKQKLNNLKVKQPVVLVGDGASVCYEHMKSEILNLSVVGENNVNCRASSVGLCAALDLKMGCLNTKFKLHYLRPSQAQRLLSEKQKVYQNKF